MKKIAFLGATDKSHLLLALGKLLAAAGQRVLLVDSSMAQTVLGYLPRTDDRPGAFVTEFEGFDVAVGFLTYGQLDRHVNQTEGGWPHYDVLLLDTDHSEFMERHLPAFDHYVWCGSFEKLTLQKNKDLMRRLGLDKASEQPLVGFKMWCPFVESTIPEAYFDSFYSGFHIRWEEPVFRIPLSDQDLSVMIGNQHQERVSVKGLSGTYAKNVQMLAQVLFGLDGRTVKRAWKRMRRDRRGA